MSVLQSLKNIVEALFAPAEDPRKTLAYTYQHQNELLRKVREAITNMRTARTRLDEKINSVKARVPDLEKDARTALREGEEDRARFTLQRKEIALVELSGLEAQLADVTQEEQRLSLIEQRLVTQIEALLARQELISARHSAAEAQVYINQEIGSVSEELSELNLALADAEARAERLEQRASALEQITAINQLKVPEHGSSARVQESIQRLNLSEAVEQALIQLKQEQASNNNIDPTA